MGLFLPSARESGLTTHQDGSYEDCMVRGRTVGRSLFDADMSARVVRIHHFSVVRRSISGLGIFIRRLSYEHYIIAMWSLAPAAQLLAFRLSIRTSGFSSPSFVIICPRDVRLSVLIVTRSLPIVRSF